MTEMQRDMVKLHLHRYNDYILQTVQKRTVCKIKIGHLRRGKNQTADSPGSSRRVRSTAQLPRYPIKYLLISRNTRQVDNTITQKLCKGKRFTLHYGKEERKILASDQLLTNLLKSKYPFKSDQFELSLEGFLINPKCFPRSFFPVKFFHLFYSLSSHFSKSTVIIPDVPDLLRHIFRR